MREYLFRGKRADNGEWVEGYLVKDPQSRYRIYWQPFAEASSNTYHFILPETVGQYTGLTDKNGVKIFEGDVIEYCTYGHYVQQSFPELRPEIDEHYLKRVRDVVVFRNGAFTLSKDTDFEFDIFGVMTVGDYGIKSIDDAMCVIFGENRTQVFSEEEMECDCNGNRIDESILGITVIGNIHENSNLIN